MARFSTLDALLSSELVSGRANVSHLSDVARQEGGAAGQPAQSSASVTEREWAAIADDLGDLMRIVKSIAPATAPRPQSAPSAVVPPPPQASNDDLHLLAELRMAMASPNSGLRMHYQPLVDAQSGALNGFEALLRWTTRDGETINPMRTVDLAARHGLGEALDLWVVQAVAIAAGGWLQRHPDLVIAINVTNALLTNPACAHIVENLLRSSNVPTRNVCIEVTEIVLLNEQTTSNLHALRALGVKLAIDDFGTGFSALSRLMDVPVDTVKLDRSFIMGRKLSPQDEAFLEAMVRMGHARGATVTIEGVSRAEDVDLARRIGCDTCQGYWFAQAISAEMAEKLVSSETLPWLYTTSRWQN